ncbi:MAG: hypothetical protein OXI01_04645 [Albidovulum sp.]|nr:hypothetical protein [Albidovulum sp.]
MTRGYLYQVRWGGVYKGSGQRLLRYIIPKCSVLSGSLLRVPDFVLVTRFSGFPAGR